MTCPRCNDTGYLRDRSWCSCDARPFNAGARPEPKPWSDEELAFLLRLREQSSPGLNAEPENHDEPAPPVLEPVEPVSKADALMERARRMGRAS